MGQTTADKAGTDLAGFPVFGLAVTAGHDRYEKIFNRDLAEACKAAGVPKVTAHDLRRTFAALANAAGAGVRDLQVCLGHSSTSTTLGYIGAEQRDAARRVEAALSTGRQGPGRL
jgi:integrase